MVLQVQGEARLGLHQEEHRRQAEELDEGDGPGIGLPVHILIFPDTHEPVEAALQGAEEGMQERASTLQDPGHVDPEGIGQTREQGQVQQVLSPGVAHWNFSGFSRAKTR